MKKIFDRLFRIGIITFLGMFTSESSLHVNESKSQLKTTQIENLRMKSNSLNTIKFKKIECGFHHCLALDENDRLWAWGANGSGQIGNGTFDSASHPIQIMPQKKFKDIAATYNYSGALDFEGDGYIWGGGTNVPSLQNGKYSFISGTTSEDNDKIFLTNSSSKYFPSSDSNIITKTIIGNSSYTGTWGHFDKFLFLDTNNTPRIYNGSIKEEYRLNEKVFYKKVVGNYNLLSSGYNWNLLAITTEGKLKTKASYFKSGNLYSIKNYFSDIDYKEIATQKIIDIAVLQSRVTRANDKASGYLINEDNVLYSFGENSALNILGTQESISLSESMVPIKVASNEKFKDVSCGEDFACALTLDGRLYSWGNNGFGQLGQGNFVSLNVATESKTLSSKKYFNINANYCEKTISNFTQENVLSYNILEKPLKGTATIDKDGVFTYVPGTNEFGADRCVIQLDYGSFKSHIVLKFLLIEYRLL